LRNPPVRPLRADADHRTHDLQLAWQTRNSRRQGTVVTLAVTQPAKKMVIDRRLWLATAIDAGSRCDI
jgi:hypothetical protein